MRIETLTHGVELTPALEEHIDRRLRFALTRFGGQLRQVHLTLADVNGPRGGKDIHCKIRVDLDGRSDLVVREVQADPFAAVARAAERTSHALSRGMDRIHDRRRGRGSRSIRLLARA